jgi:CBS domain containing-hemolysin-like protein
MKIPMLLLIFHAKDLFEEIGKSSYSRLLVVTNENNLLGYIVVKELFSNLSKYIHKDITPSLSKSIPNVD